MVAVVKECVQNNPKANAPQNEAQKACSQRTAHGQSPSAKLRVFETQIIGTFEAFY